VLPPSAADLAFVAPGLVHQFGNLLFTIQGQALTLSAEALQRGRAAILTACERGSLSLRLWRHLLGDSGPDRAPVGAVVHALAELLRVPVREAGQLLHCDEAVPGHGAVVELGCFVPVAIAMVRTLVHAVPAGVQGTVTLASTAPELLQVGFRAAAGGLPFPLALAAALPSLQALARRHGLDGALHGHREGFVLHAGAGVPGRAADAQA
jgi:hypothetical protein